MCNDGAMSEDELDTSWLDDFARTLGLDPVDASVIDQLLDLAGDAARESGDRRNAPISCFLAGLRLGSDGTTISGSTIQSLHGEKDVQ